VRPGFCRRRCRKLRLDSWGSASRYYCRDCRLRGHRRDRKAAYLARSGRAGEWKRPAIRRGKEWSSPVANFGWFTTFFDEGDIRFQTPRRANSRRARSIPDKPSEDLRPRRDFDEKAESSRRRHRAGISGARQQSGDQSPGDYGGNFP